MTRLELNLKNRQTLGAWLTLPGVQLADAVCACGFDWMAVDLEHAALTVSDAIDAFIAAERRGVAPLARLPSADPYLARRLLDGGAAGLIVPVVEDASAFAEFAAHCLYPPRGRRGVGLSRMNGWGESFKDYLGEFSPLLIPQIETVKGVANASAIAKLDVVDGVFIGPYDLSLSLGEDGDFTTPAFTQAWEEVMTAVKATGKPIGIHQVEPDPVKLQARFDEGFSFVAYGTDVIALRHVFRGLKDRSPR